MKNRISRIFCLFALLGSVAASAGERDYLEWAGVSEAHKVTKGNGVTIAVLNTGVNYQLPEFRGQIAKDAEGNYGYDAVTGKLDPMDSFEFGLGTQVASIEAGAEFGIAPEAKLIPVRIFDENGGSTLEVIARAVSYAIGRGARIIELGGGPLALERNGTVLCEMLKQASARGALVVLPAGNEGLELKEYPIGCSVANSVTVAAANDQGELSRYSNYGFPAVQLAALGENIWGVSRDGSIQKKGVGTTYASAFTAGVAALVWSAHPEYSAAEVKTALIRGAVARDSLRGKVLANGYLNAALALQADPKAVE